VGTCLGVGVGGLTLGGGLGYSTRSAGLTCDHLRSSRIVTASGDLLGLDAAHHSDLFWACRGGTGGSFGINTSFTFDLVEVPRKQVSYYVAEWRGAEAATAAFIAFDEIMRTAPAAFNAVLMVQAAPVAAAGPREAMYVWTRGQYIGLIAELWDLLAPLLKAAGAPLGLEFYELPFWEAQHRFTDSPSKPHSFGDISRTPAARSRSAPSRRWSIWSRAARPALTSPTDRSGTWAGSAVTWSTPCLAPAPRTCTAG
jgi:FAD/FMN-containing dehydrogenase